MMEIAWNQQVLQHADWLRTVVRSRVMQPQEADDLLQNVLAQALALDEARRDEVRSLGPWLYRLAVRAVLQFRRKSGRRRRLHKAANEGRPQWEEQQPLDILLGEERSQLVRRALAALAGDDAEILLLKYVHNWGYAEIRDHLGLESHRIAYRLRRARERLRSELTRTGLDTTPPPGGADSR